jgi:S-adenosylmethionine/arginine decarboxylase-like enzyme
MDIFTCNLKLKPNKAIEKLKRYLKTDAIMVMKLDRGAYQ